MLCSCSRTGVLERTEKPVAVITVNNPTVLLGRTVTLDGSSSSDPFGEPLQFIWRLREAPVRARATLSHLDTPNTTVTPDIEGAWVAELVVTAGDRMSLPAVAMLSVTRPIHTTNRPPVANFEVVSTGGAFVRFDGSRSVDPDGDALTYAWRVPRQPQGAQLTLGPAGANLVDGVVRVMGQYEIELEVSDGRGGRDSTKLTLQLPLVSDGGVVDGGQTLPGYDQLDPDTVYMLGTLEPGVANRQALAHYSTPDEAAYGFGTLVGRPGIAIRPTDGRVLYLDNNAHRIRTFTCDLCPFAPPVSGTWSDNDVEVPTPCPGVALDFRVGPGGEIWTQCGTNQWRAPPEITNVISLTELISVGRGLVLAPSRVHEVGTGMSRVHTLPRTIVAARWKPPSSFYAVTVDAMQVATLWEVGLQGEMIIGTYPPMPADQGSPRAYVLDTNAQLFNIASNGNIDTIVSRSTSGASSVVYSEATNPLVQLDRSTLVTGP